MSIKKEVSSEPSRMDQKAQRKAAFALSPSIIWSAIHSLTAGEYFYIYFSVELAKNRFVDSDWFSRFSIIIVVVR